ncbi:MAG: hypothetical protein QXE32_05535 [Sulfolobales archaeon]
MTALTVRSIYLALLSVLDLVFILILVLELGADPRMLGLIGMLWSLIYVIFSLIADKLGVRGSITLISVVSSLAFLISVVILFEYSRYLYYIVAGYMMHSIATAMGRVSNNISINESYYYEEWSSKIFESQIFQRFAYAGVLSILILAGLNIIYSIYLLPFYITLALLFPLSHEFRGFERRYSSIVSTLDTINHATRFTTVTLGNSSIWLDYKSFSAVFGRYSTARCLLSALLSSIAIEILMLPIPAVMKRFMDLRELLLIYVIIGLLGGISLILLKNHDANLLSSGLMRIIALGIVFLSIGLTPSIAGIVLLGVGFALISISNNLYVTTALSIYNTLSHGFGSGIFIAVLEIGGLAGDLLLWLYVGGLSYEVIMLISGALFLLTLLILR